MLVSLSYSTIMFPLKLKIKLSIIRESTESSNNKRTTEGRVRINWIPKSKLRNQRISTMTTQELWKIHKQLLLEEGTLHSKN